MTSRIGPKKGMGEKAMWLKDRVNHDGAECLIWPFFRLPAPHGRGMLGYMGRQNYAHRLMCIFVHGDPPTPKHEAAHNCGNGHLGCVHPKHIEWKTRSQNQQDRKKHGTQAGNCNGPTGKLSFEAADEIRRLYDSGALQRDLAERFGVTESAISKICKGLHFSRPHKLSFGWSAEQEATLREVLGRGDTYTAAAKATGKSVPSVIRKSRALGLVSGWDPHAPRKIA